MTLDEFLLIVEELKECMVHQGGFPCTTRSGNNRKASQVYRHVDMFEIVLVCFSDCQRNI